MHRASLILSEHTNPLQGFVSRETKNVYDIGMQIDADTATDEVVAAAVQKGDNEIFGVLVRRYEKKLLRSEENFYLIKAISKTSYKTFLSAHIRIYRASISSSVSLHGYTALRTMRS